MVSLRQKIAIPIQYLKLMPEYECYPTWQEYGEVYENIDPNELPISEKLKHDLLAWADVLDGTLGVGECVMLWTVE